LRGDGKESEGVREKEKVTSWDKRRESVGEIKEKVIREVRRRRTWRLHSKNSKEDP
jgi:hypothetical protein